MKEMRRRLARVGDRITYGTRNGSRTGTFIRQQSFSSWATRRAYGS